jgi:hypothetical protein
MGFSLILPNWLLLLFCVPLLMVLSNISLIPPLLAFGEADIQAYDLIILVIFLKVIASVAVKRRKIYVEYIHLPISAFLLALLVATTISYYRFGPEVFKSEMVAYLRFLSQASVYFLLIYSGLRDRELELSHKTIELIGYTIAFSIYINLILSSFGIRFGEVQIGPEFTRFFGPLGDQVGYVLPLFIYKELLARNVPGASFLGGALLATGTRGAFIALSIGLVLFLVTVPREHLRERSHALPLATFVGITCLALWLDPGSMMARFLNPEFIEFGLTQRITTMTIAMKVFLHNILFGVGFTGFRFAALDYGAEGIFSLRLSYYSPAFIATTTNQYLQVATDGGILTIAPFFWMVTTFLRKLKTASGYASNKLYPSLGAGYIWLWALLIGNQTAVWLLPGSIISYMLWIILGIATVAMAPTRRPALINKENLVLQRT